MFVALVTFAALATLARRAVACALLGVLLFPGGAFPLTCPPLPPGVRCGRETSLPAALPLEGGGIVGGITPHHDVAGAMILRFYATLKASGVAPRRVLLIGPDHHRAGRGPVSVCGADWETQYGALSADADAVAAIVRSGGATRDDRIFPRDHGITTHLPLIRAAFPGASVIPLVVRNSVSDLQLLALRKILLPIMRNGGLVILSMDLSHHKPSRQAMREDARTLPILTRMDSESLRGLDIDCPRGAALFLAMMRDLGDSLRSLRSPGAASVVLEHTNSGVLTGTPDAPCTSYATMLFPR